MRRYALLTGYIWFFLGLLILVLSLQMGLGELHFPGPGFFPFLNSIVFSFLSVLLILESRGRKTVKDEAGSPWRGIKLGRIALSTIALVSYTFLLDGFGFFLDTFLLMLFLFKIAGVEKWIKACLSSFVSVVLCYVIFGLLLGIQLPSGFLEGILF